MGFGTTTAKQKTVMTAATGVNSLEQRIKSVISHHCEDSVSSVVLQLVMRLHIILSTLFSTVLNFQLGNLKSLDVSSEFCR